jgi:hypothetical protein
MPDTPPVPEISVRSSIRLIWKMALVVEYPAGTVRPIVFPVEVDVVVATDPVELLIETVFTDSTPLFPAQPDVMNATSDDAELFDDPSTETTA